MTESDGMTLEEIGKRIMERGGRDARDLERITKITEKSNAELCDVCRERRDKYSRGFVTIPDDEGNIWKVHYECIIMLIKEFQKIQQRRIYDTKIR